MIDAVLILPLEDFHRLIVILSWNWDFLTLVRLECCFKSKIRRKRNFAFCLFVFDWYGWIDLWKRKLFCFFLFWKGVLCSRFLRLFSSVRWLFRVANFLPPQKNSFCRAKKFLYIGTLQNPNVPCRIKKKFLQIIFQI